jgi:hypothetical protein
MRPRWRSSPGAGGCDFAKKNDPDTPLWTAEALPSVTAVAALPPELAHPQLKPLAVALSSIVASEGDDYVIERFGATLRVHSIGGEAGPAAVVLPFDDLFEVRVAAALRLWRVLKGRQPGTNPAALTEARRKRLVLALRALDGRLDGATHREIAAALFGENAVRKRDWISHDLRDRTARLVRLGLTMMNGGYRRLLLHPYRGRP